MNEVDLAEIRKFVSYDPLTGEFTVLMDRGKARAGDKAGSLHNNGYWKIGFAGKKYLAHRLAWAMFYGSWPKLGVDHKDGDKLNNKIENLRLATKSQNRANTPGFSKRGVRIDNRIKEGNKYVAKIEFDGRRIHLGSFRTRELAEEFRILAAELLFGEFVKD